MSGSHRSSDQLSPRWREDDFRHDLIGQTHSANPLQAFLGAKGEQSHAVVAAHFAEDDEEGIHWTRFERYVVSLYVLVEDLMKHRRNEQCI